MHCSACQFGKTGPECSQHNTNQADLPLMCPAASSQGCACCTYPSGAGAAASCGPYHLCPRPSSKRGAKGCKLRCAVRGPGIFLLHSVRMLSVTDDGAVAVFLVRLLDSLFFSLLDDGPTFLRVCAEPGMIEDH